MAIRDQSYTRYDGPLREKFSWAVIGWTGFRTYWSFWRTKLTIFAIWLIPVVFALLIITEAAFSDQAQMVAGETPAHGGIRFLLIVQLFALALVFMARGCGIISDDLRHRTLQLYFSKPISKLDYAAGKLCTLLLLGLIAVFIPSVALAGLRTAFYAQTEILGDIIVLHTQAMVLLALVVVLLSSVVIGISSLTRRTGYAVLALIGILLVPLIVQGIVVLTTDGSPWAAMLSINGIVGLAADALLGGADAMADEIPRWLPFVAIFALIGAGLSALNWRLSRPERIT